MIHAKAPEQRIQPDDLMFGVADVLAAMGVTALLAGLFLGAVVGLAYPVAQVVTRYLQR